MTKPYVIIVSNETFKMYPMTCPNYNKIIDIKISLVKKIACIVSVNIYSEFIYCQCWQSAVFAIYTSRTIERIYVITLHELSKTSIREMIQLNKKLIEHLKILTYFIHKYSLKKYTSSKTLCKSYNQLFK